jgi:uncharacterized protein DUF1844
MAEVQTNTQTGELAQRFVEFVMMQAQNAALFLGQIPNPKTGQGEVNLELAKIFIDQLAMIQEKTRGNLSNEEASVLRNAISNLQMAYVEVAAQHGQETAAAKPADAEPENAPSEMAASDQAKETPEATISTSASGESESKKKFTKSYGS